MCGRGWLDAGESECGPRPRERWALVSRLGVAGGGTVREGIGGGWERGRGREGGGMRVLRCGSCGSQSGCLFSGGIIR